MEILTGAVAGLGGIALIVVAVIILALLVLLFGLPIKILYNGIVGAIILWIFNLIGGLIGFTVPINVVSALIAGFFGIPGAAVVILWNLFAR
jgi:inhibitor of the pro-sigma K processing machinery